MNMLEKITNGIKNPKVQRNILAVIAVVLAIMFFRGCGTGISDAEVLMYEQNINALQDSVRTYKDKNGELVYEKSALITSTKDLKDYNAELAEEVKALKDNPIVITKFKTTIAHDTAWLKPSIDAEGITYNNDSTIKFIPFTWGYDTTYAPGNYKNISGRYIVEIDTAMNVSSSWFSIDTDSMGISFTTGITENSDGLLEIFIKSPYPNFTPTGIDGALIDPRESDVIKKFFPPKRWSVGPYVGYGIYFDPSKTTLGTGVSAGISITYGVFQWGKK